MRWLPGVFLLVGCSSSVEAPVAPSKSSWNQPNIEYRFNQPDDAILRLSATLNASDAQGLKTQLQPPHPLAQWEPQLQDDPAWRELVEQWVDELMLHAGAGQWQLRSVDPRASGWRAEYRLVHENFAVEFFYFDIGEGPAGPRIEDMGNHLFQMSQVELMDHLYHQLMAEYGEEDQPFKTFFAQLQPYGEGRLAKSVFVKHYRALPQELQNKSLTRELMLRALSGNEDEWFLQLPDGVVHRLYGDDYRLMQTNYCLADIGADCRSVFQRLPSTLRSDAALQTEMGIRALQRGDLGQARVYADRAMADSQDYLPTFWLSLQVALGQEDHSGAVASLDTLTRNFDLPLEKDVLFEIYPEEGERFLTSPAFYQWAQSRQGE
ncbi:hypothetical protein [Ferrimonas balearica]|uniref:hypothetical protein n=1 Tax=Ferrimonas balearica TaxID=44012 RepID=UPI001C98EA21|nr:hypothetical protein [Ferrimonas balearica]MBY5991434.1 hypothetical protein [Ferrimonas balearica]